MYFDTKNHKPRKLEAAIPTIEAAWKIFRVEQAISMCGGFSPAGCQQ
jgi:hypothetical protein